jgi:taurine dioxygenase
VTDPAPARPAPTPSTPRSPRPDVPGVLEIVPSGGPLGAEIRGLDLARPLAPAVARTVRAAWLEHQVLVFPGQRLDDPALIAVARLFGEPHTVEICEYDRSGLLPEIDVISNVRVNGRPIGALGAGEAAWHTDMSMFDIPASATLLYGIDIPATPNDTRFADMYAAYETLDPALKAAIEGRTSIHDIAYNAAGAVREGFEAVTDKSKGPGAVHPIVRRHPETGRRALYLGRRGFGYIHGLPVPESDRLLEALWAHMSKPEFAWSHAWRPGDLVVWDNRCVIHSRGAFDPAARRLLHRVTVKGERPAGSP